MTTDIREGFVRRFGARLAVPPPGLAESASLTRTLDRVREDAKRRLQRHAYWTARYGHDGAARLTIMADMAAAGMSTMTLRPAVLTRGR